MDLDALAQEFIDPAFPGYEVVSIDELPIEGIFSFQYVEFDGVTSNYPVLLTLYGQAQEGDVVSTSRGVFVVEQIEDDGAGMQRNILRAG